MPSEILASAAVGGCRLEAVRGDMTAETTDAIVNAANSGLEHGGGLAGAIVRAGGDGIQRESDRLAPVPVGGAATTSAGRLGCRWVVHAVGPRWGEGDEEAKLRSAVRSALDEAARVGARSVSLPAISTGIFGYPKQDGVRVLVDEACGHPAVAGGAIERLRLVAFDDPTATLFAEAVGARGDDGV
jgi:O-acetyl-ADP-ribose deacetylase (regulator of RNase III)